MKVAVACDHRGFEGKKKLLPILIAMGHHVSDLGCNSGAACDYPDFAAPLAQAIAEGQYDVGILLDGTGIGMSIVANKICGIRAALAHDEVTARRARTHNHCNVLCVGTDLISEDHLKSIVEVFLNTGFEPGRHDKRIEKIAALEKKNRHSP